MKKDETPAGEARGNPIIGGMGYSNITTKHNKSIGFSGFYCKELGFYGVSHCTWQDCSYANTCKALRA
jgi:hypothetical protein